MQKLNETELKNIIGGEKQPLFIAGDPGNYKIVDPNDAEQIWLSNGTKIIIGEGPA